MKTYIHFLFDLIDTGLKISKE